MKLFKKSYPKNVPPFKADNLGVICNIASGCSTTININKNSPFNVSEIVDEELFHMLIDRLDQYPDYDIIGVADISFDNHDNQHNIRMELNGKAFTSSNFYFGLLDNVNDPNVCMIVTDSIDSIQIKVHFSTIITTDTIRWFLMSSCVQDEMYTYSSWRIHEGVIELQPSMMMMNSTLKDTSCSLYKVSNNIVRNLQVIASMCSLKWIHDKGRGHEKNLDLTDVPTKTFYIKTKYTTNFEDLCNKNGLQFRRYGHPLRDDTIPKKYKRECDRLISYFYYLSG